MQHAAYLLAGAEIVQCHFGEVAAFDGDNALMAVLLRPLVHGERQVAAAEQLIGAGGRGGFQQGGQRVGLGARIAAQRAGVGAVGEQHRDRAVAFGLQAERAAEFQRAGQRGGERQGLAGEPRDDGVVVVAGQQRVGQRAEPHQPAAHRAVRQVERRDAARHHDIGHRRTGGVEEGGRLRHCAQDRHARGAGLLSRPCFAQ